MTDGSNNLFYRNPLGLLNHIIARGPGTVTNLDYVGSQLAGEYDGSTGALKRRYVFDPTGGDTPLVQYEGSGTNARMWLHADERGSIVALTDQSGNAVAVNSYDEYGIPAVGNAGRFQYTGQMWIPELGMYDYKARVYSPTLGRFLQSDPIGYGDGMNMYNYVGGDPLNLIDPSGMCEKIYKGFSDGHLEFVGFYGSDCGGGAGGGSGGGFGSGNSVGGTGGASSVGGGIGGSVSRSAAATPQNDPPQLCPIAYTPSGDSKGNNPVPQGDRYNTDLPGGYEAATAAFLGLSRLHGINNGGDGGFKINVDPRRPTTAFVSNSGNVGLRWAVRNGGFAWRIDIKPNTFSLSKTKTIHFNDQGRGNMCPTR